LPGRAEQGGVRRPEEPEHRVAIHASKEADPAVEAELARALLERRSLSAPPAVGARASSATPSDFCGPSRPAKASTSPSSRSSARSSSRGGSEGTSGDGFGKTETRSGSSPHPSATPRRYALG